jgi:hypothetical protein
MSARKLAAALAVSAAVAATGGAQADAHGQALGFQSFTAGNGRVLCNLLGREASARQTQLVCWLPATGSSVSLVAAGGRPKSTVSETLRGARQPAPSLRPGKQWVVNYAGAKLLLCAGKATGVACNNGRGHGFLFDAHGITTY